MSVVIVVFVGFFAHLDYAVPSSCHFLKKSTQSLAVNVQPENNSFQGGTVVYIFTH